MTLLIIIITCFVSYMCFNNYTLFEKLKFNPYRIHMHNEYYRFITHGFVHADSTHLIFNMMTLYFAGTSSERIFSPSIVYVLFYILALIASSLPDYFKHKNNPYYSAIGASGAVSAVLFSLVLFAPWGVVNVYFIIPIYFILFAVLYLAFSYHMAKKQIDHIGHNAHFYGALFGVIATIVYDPTSLRYFLNSLFNPPFLSLFR